MWIRVVNVICLAILAAEMLAVIINILLKKRPQRIAFLRTFKKGKCAIIYVTAIPLYFIGHVYAERGIAESAFDAISKSINLVVLRYDTSTVSKLMGEDPVYRFTIYLCFVLVAINALIFTLSLTSQYIWCAIQACKATMTRRDKLFLFGNNPENIAIYKSDRTRSKAIIDDISDKDSERLYMDRIAFISTRSYNIPLNKLAKMMKKQGREYILVVNTGDDERNIAVCRSIIDRIKSADEEVRNSLFLRTKVYVFGNPRYATVYEDIVSDGFGCIHYVNKYQKIAVDFIDKYPLAKFMDETQVDYETSLIREDVDINVFMIGFGKTNQQIFLTSVANNQFLTAGEDDPTLKKVKYFIFDKDAAENNKNLNHSYYRFKHECSELRQEDYLPLPTLPAEEFYHRLDVNDCDFYNRIRTVVTRNAKDANFILIAFGTDLENMDMAQKLVEKRREWGLGNLVIFVKVRVWHKEQTLLEDEGCYFIGNEKDVIYHVDKIVGDRMFHMAQMRNEVYDLEYDITHNEGIVVDEAYVKKNHDASYQNWYKSKSQMERESSLYCCLSLRSKLNLMGLDYCEIDGSDEAGLSEEAYLAHYAGADMPDTDSYGVRANGKPIIHYGLDFPRSRRRNMAIHEHLRWNSFMISKGMVPSSLAQIATEKTVDKKGREKYTNGKNYLVRRHGNLTTFAGLVEFRRMVAARDGRPEEEVDVIKYDYQLLDDAYWLLNANGYKIVRHEKMK